MKKSLNLEKDTEDNETILQNTYQPEHGSPRYTKNKQREKETVGKNNFNSWNQEELQISKGKGKNKRELPQPPVSEDTSPYIQEDKDAEVALEPPALDRGKKPRRKSKKGKNKQATEAKAENRVEDAEDKLQHDYLQQIVQEEEEDSVKKSKTNEESVVSPKKLLNNDIGKKKKKKLKSVITQSEEWYVSSSVLIFQLLLLTPL